MRVAVVPVVPGPVSPGAARGGGGPRREYRGRAGPPNPAPSRGLIIRKVPAGSVRLTGRRIERACLDALAADPRWRALRPAARRSVSECAKWLARTADYDSGTTRPTRLAVAQLAGICVRTWQRCRARLEDWGYLALVRAGMRLRDHDGAGEAAVYVVCVPRRPPPGGAAAQPSGGSVPPTGDHNHHAQLSPHERRPRTPGKAGGARSARPVPPAVAGAVRKGPFKGLSDEAVAAACRRFVAAGWSPAALGWAVDHDRDGTWHFRPLDGIRWPAGLLRWRLSRHLDAGGQPLAASLERARAHDGAPPPPAALCRRCGRAGHEPGACPW